MKKKRDSGKNLQNKSSDAGVTVYQRGRNHAYYNMGCCGGHYVGHLKKCYMNGYKEGQAQRQAEKARAAQETNK